MNTETMTIEQLVKLRALAKASEESAVALRRSYDAQIADLLRGDIDEGSVTTKIAGFRVATTFGIDRKVDTAQLTEGYQNLSAMARTAFRWKAEVDTKAYKALPEHDRLAAAKFITSKPTTPSVKVELVEAA